MSRKIARFTPELSNDWVVRAMSIDLALLPHIGDALGNLADDWQWEVVGDDIETITQEIQRSLDLWYSNMLIGLVGMFAVGLPNGWLLLDGSTHLKADYPELWELLDSSMKTASDFTLPNMIDSFPMGVGTLPGIGATGGNNSYQLTEGQLPAHTHNYIPSPLGVSPGMAGPATPAAVPAAAIPTTATGSGDAIDNRPEYVTFTYAIYAGRE